MFEEGRFALRALTHFVADCKPGEVPVDQGLGVALPDAIVDVCNSRSRCTGTIRTHPPKTVESKCIGAPLEFGSNKKIYSLPSTTKTFV